MKGDMKPCSNLLTGSVVTIFPRFSRVLGVCTLSLKKDNLYLRQQFRGRVPTSDSLDPSSSSGRPEEMSFCWNGFCARDYFKHSEVKWRQLPWLLS
jgi:hypothetical protein